MKSLFLMTVSILLLAGCTQEIENVKEESKEVIQNTEITQGDKEASDNLSDEEKSYMKTVNKALETFANDTSDINNLIEEAKNDQEVIDDEWVNNLTGGFLSIEMMMELLAQMDYEGVVPERFLDLHSNVLGAFESMRDAGVKLITSLRDGDRDMFNDSMQLIDESNEKLTMVNEELKSLNQN
ncbi:MAG: hypothetical protein ABS939_08400 [Psychrobacillus sp.]